MGVFSLVGRRSLIADVGCSCRVGVDRDACGTGGCMVSTAPSVSNGTVLSIRCSVSDDLESTVCV